MQCQAFNNSNNLNCLGFLSSSAVCASSEGPTEAEAELLWTNLPRQPEPAAGNAASPRGEAAPSLKGVTLEPKHPQVWGLQLKMPPCFPLVPSGCLRRRALPSVFASSDILASLMICPRDFIAQLARPGTVWGSEGEASGNVSWEFTYKWTRWMGSSAIKHRAQ